MGSILSKRLAFIRDQATDTSTRISFRTAFTFSLICVAVAAGILSYIFPSGASNNTVDDALNSVAVPSLSERVGSPNETDWERTTRLAVQERTLWLHENWLGAGVAEGYRSLANTIAESFDTAAPPLTEAADIDIFTAFGLFGSRVVVGFLLRLGFAIFAGWPLWILGAIGGLIYFQYYMRPTPTTDLLGVCDRRRSPFYSGIHGPFRPNNGDSATEFSCPGLACPKQSTVKAATDHNLSKILKHYSASNQTTLELTRIVLAYRDLPAIVDEERVIDDDPDSPSATQTVSPTKTNEEGTVERSAVEGLLAILSAHQVLRKYYNQYAPELENPLDEEQLFGSHREKLLKASSKLNPLARTLLLALTPSRGRLLAQLSPQLVAGAYLATEAGKSLVYRREGPVFIQISRFPHLQSRAVLQSILSYHHEFSGEERLVIRQAILCSRRHGDFGRTFLPANMNVGSRALRDWLEILYWHPKKRADIAQIVEIEAHLEEIHTNWREHLSQELGSRSRSGGTADISTFDHQLWKGLPYKSVVLFPLRELVRIALAGLSTARIDRVMELVESSRNLQALMNISARLPGFKRQTVEAEKDERQSGGITRELADNDTEGLVPQWLIVRRMLTRYNWLSTRIGDDNVPVDGLVNGIVIERDESKHSQKKTLVHGLEALVPVRQRRFREYFGPRWELLYYSDAPHVNAIEVWIDSADYREKLAQRQSQAKLGALDRAPAQTASSSSS